MSQTIRFLGAAQTVTGSRHLLTLNGKRVLVDCGLFQGARELRERNWQPFMVEPSSIDAIVLTHAHTDHIGYLPKLVVDGFRGPVYCTEGTLGLARISLPDSGRLQEEDARRANKHGYSRHKPALPLYTERDAFTALKLLEPLHYHEFHDLPGKATFRFIPAGHILGSAYAEVYFENGERILMSGDLGRYGTAIIRDPEPVEYAEYLVLESTYGDRLHPHEDVLDILEHTFKDAVERGGAVIVPSFAIGRTQELLYAMHELQDQGRMPRLPIFIDSPMATSTTELYARTSEDHDSDMKLEIKEGHDPLHPAGVRFVRDANESKALNSQHGPMVIISGSGMANGGRITHHLKHRLDDPKTTVLFTGFQAEGTLGRELIDGAERVTIHGQEIAVRAHLARISALSAHADYGEILRWLANFKAAPRRTFLVHGEPAAQEALRQRIVDGFGWDVSIPAWGEEASL